MMENQYDPMKVEKTDHPDVMGGIVWTDCELVWIRAYGTRCYNHGKVKGREAGRLLFEEPKVGTGGTAVTREMRLVPHLLMALVGTYCVIAYITNEYNLFLWTEVGRFTHVFITVVVWPIAILTRKELK